MLMPAAEEVTLACVECGRSDQTGCPLPIELQHARWKYAMALTEEDRAIADETGLLLLRSLD